MQEPTKNSADVATDSPRASAKRIERIEIGPDGVPEISRKLPAYDESQSPHVAQLLRDVVAEWNAQVAADAAVVSPMDDASLAAVTIELTAETTAGISPAADAANVVQGRWPFVERRERPRGPDRIERVVNLAIASTGLVIAAPLMALVALAVRLSSPGPVLYQQERVGLDLRSGRDRRRTPFGERAGRRSQNYTGRVFTIYKFRTMRVDAESGSGAVWAQKNDPRVTRLGRFLRVSRLDELPQLWNVLRGDMNVVGPRPERPTIIVSLVRDISEYPARHRARPGITGLAQITGAYDSSIEDVRQKVRHDLEYLENRSLVADLRIMIKTVPVMLSKKTGW